MFQQTVHAALISGATADELHRLSSTFDEHSSPENKLMCVQMMCIEYDQSLVQPPAHKFPLYSCLFQGVHAKTLQDHAAPSQSADRALLFEVVHECNTQSYFHICLALSRHSSRSDHFLLDLVYQTLKLRESFSIQDFVSSCTAHRFDSPYLERFLTSFIPSTIGFYSSCNAPIATLRSIADMCQHRISAAASCPDTLAVCLSAFQNSRSTRQEQPDTIDHMNFVVDHVESGGMAARSYGASGEEDLAQCSENFDRSQVIESLIRSSAKSIASGAWNMAEMDRYQVIYDVFLSKIDFYPRSQSLLVALTNFIASLKLAMQGSSCIFNQVRVPLWSLDALFGPTACILLRFPGFTANAAFGVGWCDVKISADFERMPPLAASVYLIVRASPASTISMQSICEQLKLCDSAIQTALEFLLKKGIVHRDGFTLSIGQHLTDSSDPSVQHVEASLTEPTQVLPVSHPKILRLMFRMLMLVDMAPVEEHVLIEKVLQEASDSSICDAAAALQELRSNHVLKNDGAIITKFDSNCENGLKFTSWHQPETSVMMDNLVRAFVFLPDETVFAAKDVLPWAWVSKSWISKVHINEYFQQLIRDVSSATGHNFMAVAHALQQSLGSISRSMLMLLNATEDVQTCGDSCQLRVSDDCDSSPVLKCPHCRGYCICLACLSDLHTPGRRGGFVANAEQTDEPATVTAFQYKKHSVEEFKWLYCCPHCGDLFPPSFWNHLTVLLSADEQSAIIDQMAVGISRHVRYSEDPIRDSSLFNCRREGCERFVSASSRIQMVSAV
jgi:hypothetical protein